MIYLYIVYSKGVYQPSMGFINFIYKISLIVYWKQGQVGFYSMRVKSSVILFHKKEVKN